MRQTVQVSAQGSSPVGAVVAVVMGSASDWPTMSKAVEVLTEFGVPHEAHVLSAHRMPDEMFAFAEAAGPRGLRAIIAGSLRRAAELGAALLLFRFRRSVLEVLALSGLAALALSAI